MARIIIILSETTAGAVNRMQRTDENAAGFTHSALYADKRKTEKYDEEEF
jgi:hypothetical protein